MFVQAPVAARTEVVALVNSLGAVGRRMSFAPTPTDTERRTLPAAAGSTGYPIVAATPVLSHASTNNNVGSDTPAKNTDAVNTTAPSPCSRGPLTTMTAVDCIRDLRHRCQSCDGQLAARCRSLFDNAGAAELLSFVDKHCPACRSVALADDVCLIKCCEPFENRCKECEIWSCRQRILQKSVCCKCSAKRTADAKREKRLQASIADCVDVTSASSHARLDCLICGVLSNRRCRTTSGLLYYSSCLKPEDGFRFPLV